MNNAQKIRWIKENDFPKSDLSQQIKFVLHYALLAPSTHNIQPWLFKVRDNLCEVYYDEKFTLPEADKEGRDLYISLGCMIENLEIAAKFFGIYNNTEYFFDDNYIARVFFKKPEKDLSYQEMFNAITKRINVRGIFSNRTIEPNKLDEIKNLKTDNGVNIHVLEGKENLKNIANLTAAGIRQAYNDKSFRVEMSHLINNNFSPKKHGLHGYSLRMPALISFVFPWLVRNFNMGKRLGWLNQISISSTQAACVFTSELDNPTGWLNVGKTAERLMLTVTSLGLNFSVFVASVEIGYFYKKVQELLKTDVRPQFLLCLGYMNMKQKYTPRHELEEKLIQ